MPKKKTAKHKKSKKKICNKCGTANLKLATECEQCGSVKFAPEWVVAKRSVNRQVGVEVTTINPSFGKVEKRITLSNSN